MITLQKLTFIKTEHTTTKITVGFENTKAQFYSSPICIQVLIHQQINHCLTLTFFPSNVILGLRTINPLLSSQRSQHFFDKIKDHTLIFPLLLTEARYIVIQL